MAAKKIQTFASRILRRFLGMTGFSIGDYVICLDASSARGNLLERNKVYRVRAISDGHLTRGNLSLEELPNGPCDGWLARRFILMQQGQVPEFCTGSLR
jgi:hypothetical protein